MKIWKIHTGKFGIMWVKFCVTEGTIFWGIKKLLVWEYLKKKICKKILSNYV